MSDTRNVIDPTIDLEALRAKYNEERDRRLRPDGEGQYLEVSGKYARYGEEDPLAPEVKPREPLFDEVDAIIIGGGWGGLLTAGRLREAGITDIRIIDAAADFGGTWYWNRYPGAQCDIESYCYMPLLEETGYIPTEKYAYSEELFAHAQRIGRHFKLYDKALFQTRVRQLRWDEARLRWRVSTDRGDEMMARFVVLSTGPVNRPKLPNIPGLDSFEGKMFHTSRWDYAYTGGHNRGDLTKLADKRVAVIGTGATGLQVVPHLGAAAKHLYVFQRTPSTVDYRGNKPTDPEWAKSLKPGWQRERQQNFDDILMGRPVKVDLVNDGWTELYRTIQMASVQSGGLDQDPEKAALMGEIVDAQRMNKIRARVDALVNDPAVAEVLKPWYRFICKRPGFHDEYLQTFNRSNVTLVDTSTCHGVERITPRGLVANGIEYEVDCIIFATGFEITTSFKRRLGMEIYGRKGESLYDHWASGLRTLHGYGVHGFPNWFFIGYSQNGISVNFSGTVGEQARHVAFLINSVNERGATCIEPTPQGEADWTDEIRKGVNKNLEILKDCTPGYFNNEGKLDVSVSVFGNRYNAGANAFAEVLRQWRETGEFKGVTFY